MTMIIELSTKIGRPGGAARRLLKLIEMRWSKAAWVIAQK